jgi:hypothetical protein
MASEGLGIRDWGMEIGDWKLAGETGFVKFGGEGE